MDDRLTEALTLAILTSNDDKVKRILDRVIQLNKELYYMDWNDWEEYSSSDTFQKEMANNLGGRFDVNLTYDSILL